MKKTKIRNTHGNCNGDACIGLTQIPVWKLIALCADGCSEENLLSDYPDLTKDDLKAAQTYYTQQRAEIDEAIASQNSGV